MKTTLLWLGMAVCFAVPAHARIVTIKNNQLVVDGHAQPQLFGAEVQYFRLRGGYGPNVPREKVIALWNNALDQVVAAKMNAISFYVPWDFHEYAEGQFDFTGTADEDHDGHADYPSRDLITFIKLAEAHGIKRILIRPGPYINAEWGHFGFGAIPEWFNEKFHTSHMMNSAGRYTKLVDYLDPQFLAYTQKWFSAFYQQVLKNQIGSGRPALFLQLDNETNFQWASLFENGNYSPAAISRYQDFLRQEYQTLENLNGAHGRKWASWSEIAAPTKGGVNLTEDRDWYKYCDSTIHTFLTDVREMWQNLGVREPDVMFTLAESFNSAEKGLLPNYIYKNAPGQTGLLTVNLYPKTSETDDDVLLNNPFKADLDVKSQAAADENYFGRAEDWVMGPEIQGGWWQGTDVTDASRQQTYLTVLGHGLKAMFIYYFNEGENFGVEWAKNHADPLYQQLIAEWQLKPLPPSDMPAGFWHELQQRFDRMFYVGFDMIRLYTNGFLQSEDLFFDAALNGQAEPREHFSVLKNIGEKIVAPYGDFLGRAVEVTDEVAIVRDSNSFATSPNPQIDSQRASAEWSGGLLGYLMNSGFNPQILFGDISTDWSRARVLFHVDTDASAPATLDRLTKAYAHGDAVLNFLGDETARQLIAQAPPAMNAQFGDVATLTAYLDAHGQLSSAPTSLKLQITAHPPFFAYDMTHAPLNCSPMLFAADGTAVGYQCSTANSKFTQIGALIFDEFNSNDYATAAHLDEKIRFMRALTDSRRVEHTVMASGDRVSAFARRDPHQEVLWVTVKTGHRGSMQEVHLRLSEKLLQKALASRTNDLVLIKDVMTGLEHLITVSELGRRGFEFQLASDGSTAFALRRAP